jgi:PBP1b-binding outer membrane lipoprotein LpoB
VGHDRPPLDERFTEEEIDEMRQATDTALTTLVSDTPDALTVAVETNKIVRILKRVARRSGELFATFADKAAENAGARVGDAIGWSIVGLAYLAVTKILPWLALQI